MGPPLLEARGIRVDDLAGLDLVIHPGEFVALLGPRRAKLLRVLSLREAPDSGALLWRGRPVSPLPPGPELLAQRRRELFLASGPANAPPSLRLLRLLTSLHQRGLAIVLVTESPEAALWSQTIHWLPPRVPYV